MPAERDLICADGHLERDVFFKHIDDENTPCLCGLARHVSWAHTNKSPGVSVFKPVFHDGVGWINDQDTFNVVRAQVAKEHGCKGTDLVANRETGTQIANKADDLRHRRWARDKKKGLDDVRRREIREITRKTGINPINANAKKQKVK